MLDQGISKSCNYKDFGFVQYGSRNLNPDEIFIRQPSVHCTRVIAMGSGRKHTIKTWSSTQSLTSLSCGEAECNGLRKGMGQGQGYQGPLQDFGVVLLLELHCDSRIGETTTHRLAVAVDSGEAGPRSVPTQPDRRQGEPIGLADEAPVVALHPVVPGIHEMWSKTTDRQS